MVRWLESVGWLERFRWVGICNFRCLETLRWLAKFTALARVEIITTHEMPPNGEVSQVVMMYNRDAAT